MALGPGPASLSRPVPIVWDDRAAFTGRTVDKECTASMSSGIRHSY